jgi:hypothetical protein
MASLVTCTLNTPFVDSVVDRFHVGCLGSLRSFPQSSTDVVVSEAVLVAPRSRDQAL